MTGGKTSPNRPPGALENLMPNGKAHRQITIIAGLASAGPAIYLLGDNSIFFVVGVGATMWINPDLDIHNHLGWVGELVGFDVYRDIVPHRAGLRGQAFREVRKLIFASHMPLAGTAGRFAIATLPIMCVLALVSSLEHVSLMTVALVYLGMAWSDLWHIVADVLTSGLKADRKAKCYRIKTGTANGHSKGNTRKIRGTKRKWR